MKNDVFKTIGCNYCIFLKPTFVISPARTARSQLAEPDVVPERLVTASCSPLH